MLCYVNPLLEHAVGVQELAPPELEGASSNI